MMTLNGMDAAKKSEKQSYGWRQPGSVQDWLLEEPWEFEFFQAVKLLELMQPGRMPAGEGLDPDQESIHFRSRVELAFAASEVQDIAVPRRPDLPHTVTTNLFSLGGPSGPLPLVDTQKVIEREWRKDHGMLAFLDMFHHRLLALLVKVRKAHRPSLLALRPDQGPMAQYLYSCFGLGLPTLRNRLGLPDRALLFYANILSHRPRSGNGLERLLSDYFQVHAVVQPLEGVWRPIEPEDWTAIGRSGRNQQLGRGASLGQRIWDQQGRFAVTMGPLRLGQFLDFLPLPDQHRPLGSAFRPLCELTRFFAGQQFEFSFRLRLKGQDVPGSRLSCKPGLGRTWLGWTSWLHDESGPARDSEIRLSGRPPQFPPRVPTRE